MGDTLPVQRPTLQARAVTIKNGESVSSALSLAGGAIVGFEMPSAFAGSRLMFQASSDGVTFGKLVTETKDPVMAMVEPDLYMTLERPLFSSVAGPTFVQLVSADDNYQPVAQAGDVTIEVLVRISP